MSIRTRIVLGLALAGLVAGQAMADNVKVNTPDTNKITDQVNGLVLNGQLNTGDLFSDLDANISNVKGDASATSAAIGNSLSVTLAGTNKLGGVGSLQQNNGDAVAQAVARINDVGGNASATAAAIGNSVSISVGVQ
ncbi:MAG: hypothetical protein U1E14_13680 [Geminicoccaceae bacterium]